MGSDLGFFTYNVDGRRVTDPRQIVEQVRAEARAYFADRQPVLRLLRSRPSTVEAMQVIVGYEQIVADWCGGVAVYGRGIVLWTSGDDLVHVPYGDWIVRAGRGGFRHVTDADIFAEYEAVVPAVTE